MTDLPNEVLSNSANNEQRCDNYDLGARVQGLVAEASQLAIATSDEADYEPRSDHQNSQSRPDTKPDESDPDFLA